MSKAGKERDARRAAYMKSKGMVAPRSWNGNGADVRTLAHATGTSWRGQYTSRWERGMLGGILAAKLGYGNHGVEDLVGE